MSRLPPPLPPRPSGQTQRPRSESSSSDTYTYVELEGDDFRLLLLPDRTGRRSYTLQHWDLYTAPEYLALSYSWGDKKSNAEIIINEKKFKLEMKSLEIALEYLIDRYPGK